MFHTLICLLCAITLAENTEQHKTFGEHYAHGVSVVKQVLTQQGKSPAIIPLYALTLIPELKQAFRDCKTVADIVTDYDIQLMCYQTIFNADYFWD